MPTAEPFQLRCQRLGALPVVDRFLARLGLASRLDRHLPAGDARVSLSAATAIGVLVRNLCVEREPLYALAQWADAFEPALVGLEPGQAPLLNDDRVGRALDQLFDCDRGSLLTELTLAAISEFQIDCSQLHNDSTSITLHGDYHAADGRPRGGKATPAAALGHSKDHRPDLKQLVLILTVSADGAVPLAHRLENGNTSDDTTHIQTWDELRALTGRPDFLYVADSKLCTREQMSHIDRHGGRFVTVLPRTRREDGQLRDCSASSSAAAIAASSRCSTSGALPRASPTTWSFHLKGTARYDTRPEQFNVLWSISHPDVLTGEECNGYDLVCVASERFASQLRSETRTPVVTIDQATDPDVFFPDSDPAYEHELVFVGNSRNVMRRILRDLLPTDRDLAVWGGQWEGLIDRKHVLGDRIPNGSLRKVYSSAAIVLNDHWDDMREHGFISNGIYDALACGAFVISDNVPELKERFDGAVQTYDSPDELERLIDRYASLPAQRQELGLRGRELVLGHHTFSHRVDELVDAVRKRMAETGFTGAARG